MLFGLEWSAGALWLAAALVLVIAEMLAPGFFLIFLGAGAAVVGLIALLVPGLPVIAQAVIFGVLTGLVMAVGQRWYNRSDKTSSDPLLNDRPGRLVGSIVTAVEPVDALQGRVRLGDSVWQARGVAAAVGDRLRVARCESTVLIVEHISVI